MTRRWRSTVALRAQLSGRSGTRGLTLVETLVVLAIAVLLITALLFYVFPSDDRLCRLEAERLAAYMMGASAEAVMRDGGARVVIRINENAASREVSRAGADITRELWESDRKAADFTVKNPVQITAVDTPGVPNMSSGVAYVVFLGRRTEGAIVVLTLEKAVYSVVVPPAGGEVRVEKGRASVPGAQQFERPKLPDLTGYTDTTSKGKGSYPSGGLPSSAPITRRSTANSRTRTGKAKSAKDVKKKTPKDLPSGPTQSDYDTEPQDYPTPPMSSGINSSKAVDLPSNESGTKDETDQPEAETDGGPCQTIVDCFDDGPWRTCMAGRCIVWPYGRTLMLASVQVEEPAALSDILETILGQLISQGQLNLMLSIDQPSPWLIQGTRTGSFQGMAKYGQSDGFPTYRGLPIPVVGCEAGICQSTFRPDNEENSMTLFIKDESADADACQYQALELIDVSVTAAVNVQSQPGIAGQQLPVSNMTVRGTVRRSAARVFEAQPDETLLESLENYGVSENKDTVGDGVNDGWEFVFQGAARSVFFDDDPTSREDAQPDGCEF